MKPLNDRQYAFRKGRSCDHALSRVINRLEKAKEQGQYALYVGLDISGAYDNLAPAALGKAMRRRGMDENLVQWTLQFLGERRITATTKGEAAEIKVDQGTSQGAVLSTILWSIAYDELIEEYDGGPVDFTGYADDGCWVVMGCDLPTIFEIMQRAIDKAVAWAERMSLKFSVKKTQSMIVTNKRKVIPGKLYLYGQEVELSKEVDVLGVRIDSKLNFGKHVAERVAKAKRILMATKAAVAKAWGPRPELTRWLMTGVITPILTYASHVWINALKSKSNLIKLNAVQRLGLSMIAPVRKSTPTAGMELIYDVAPIEITIRERAKINALRVAPLLGNIGNWVPRTKTLGHLRVLREQTECLPTPTDFEPRRLRRNFGIEIGDGRPRTAGIEAYTDGSKTPEGAGSGVYATRKGEVIISESERIGQASVFHAELHGIKMACRALTDCMGDDIRIMLDNQAAIKAIGGEFTNDPWVYQAAEACRALGKWNYVTVAWVAGHSNHDGNERADTAAKKGAAATSDANENPPTLMREAKAAAREISLQEWERGYRADPRFRQTKLFIEKPDRMIWREICKLSRQTVGRLVRFLTGHAYVLRTEAVIHGVEDTADISCRLCGEEDETAAHIISECPALAQKRNEVLGGHLGADISEARALANFLDDATVVALEEEVRLYPPFE